MKNEDIAHAEALLLDRAPGEVMQILHTANNRKLHRAEHAKAHALKAFKMPADEWESFCQFLTDGGGVDDDLVDLGAGKHLLDLVMQAIHDRDQSEFWTLFPHIFKHHLKARGQVMQIPGGGVRMNGGPTRVPLAASANTTSTADQLPPADPKARA